MVLVTIPISHYVEKARWALQHARVPFTERGHAMILHYRATALHGSRTVPLLVDGKRAWRDSTDILLYADEQAPADRKLYPADPALRREALDWEDEFDRRLGPQVRRLAYHRAFPVGRDMLLVLRGKVPDWELATLKAGFPLAIAVMRRGMNITAAKADESLVRVRAACDAVVQALGDRPYLVGDRFSAADLTFAALLAPLLDPPEHPVRLDGPPWPADFLALRSELSAHAAGRWALGLYARHRGPVGSL
ncbi:MAG: glutathione S-transferase family protein [Deltaproteobacteria bacterium]|nr:glutathione S-transferase family protein [Deltaproteobacteria bacterium]